MTRVQSLLEEPEREEPAIRHQLVNGGVLALVACWLALEAANVGLSVPLFASTMLVVFGVGAVTGEHVAFGFGYLSPAGRIIAIVLALAVLAGVIVTGLLPDRATVSSLLGATVGALAAQVWWVVT